MMEASDVTGELRLCMQVIATAGKERQICGKSILDRENHYASLMKIFAGINGVIYRYRNHMEAEEDVLFLRKYGISGTALAVAEKLVGDEPAVQEEVLFRIEKDLETSGQG